jgi:hypothetical protein
MNNSCWLFHKWEKWGEPKVYAILTLWGTKGQASYQTRKCLRCNKIEERLVG